MLKHYATREVKKPNGTVMIVSTGELVDDPCADCGGESVPNLCRGDGKYHHHGMIHVKGGSLTALCGPCAEKRNAEWPTRPWER